MEESSEHEKSIAQFLKFSLVGVSNGLVDFVVYFTLTRIFFATQGFILPAKAASYVVATLWSFFVNRHFTFELTHQWELAELRRFVSTVGFGIVINLGVQYLAVFVWGLHDLVGFVLAAIGTGLWGFVFSKFYVFKAHHKK